MRILFSILTAILLGNAQASPSNVFSEHYMGCYFDVDYSENKKGNGTLNVLYKNANIENCAMSVEIFQEALDNALGTIIPKIDSSNLKNAYIPVASKSYAWLSKEFSDSWDKNKGKITNSTKNKFLESLISNGETLPIINKVFVNYGLRLNSVSCEQTWIYKAELQFSPCWFTVEKLNKSLKSGTPKSGAP